MSTRVTERPAVTAPAPWSFPIPLETDLPNGLRLLTVDLPGQHVLSVRVALKLPVAGELPGTEGSTLMMARMLDEGTVSHTGEELDEIVERHGIAYGAGAGERGVHLGCEVTGRHLGTALELLRECLEEPAFPQAEVSRMMRHRLADIAHDRADPGARASLEFLTTYFDGRDRPRVPLGGTTETVSALTRDHLLERHALLGPSGGTVVLTGDLSRVPDAVGLVARTVGAWGGGGQAAPAAPPPARRAEDAGRVVWVARPGLAQTDLYLGRPGPDRRTRHGWGTYQALALLLGGSPHARIDRVLREEKGYTYGIRAGFRPRSTGGLTVVGGSVRGDVTAEALGELATILDTPGSELTQEEVRQAADFVGRTAPGRYATADSVADELVSLADDGLDADTVTRTLAQLSSLDVEQVATAWDEVRAGPGWTVVLVGDPEQVDEVAGLGLGPVSVVTG